jgi:hypothetical protein
MRRAGYSRPSWLPLAFLLLPGIFIGRLEAQSARFAGYGPAHFSESRWRPSLGSAHPSTSATAKAHDYRWEGLAIGAGVLGVAGGVIANGLCTDSDSANHGDCTGRTIGGALLGAAVGAVVGVFLGSLFEKGT